MRRSGRTLLGFDYGKLRIGVAVGQELTETSTPLATLDTINQHPDWDAISQLIQTWHPDGLVVGLPLNLDGTEQEMTHAARQFARRLADRYHLPVAYADERLSSIEARQMLRSRANTAGARRSRRRRQIDEVAAHLILQTFFSQSRTERKANGGDGRKESL